MDATERAAQFWNRVEEIENNPRLRASDVRGEVDEALVACIRAAGAEALERAAKAVEEGLAFHSYAGASAAAIVRSLKEPTP